MSAITVEELKTRLHKDIQELSAEIETVERELVDKKKILENKKQLLFLLKLEVVNVM